MLGSTMREALAAQVGDVYWSDLRAHALRGALLVVGAELDMVDVAVALASDDAASVAGWVGEGMLGKPTGDQLQAWESEEGPMFRTLIVQPWVLLKKLRE
jgi:hypothetical protein